MEIIDFSRQTDGFFAEWLIRNFREYYSELDDRDYYAFDLRSYGISIENNPIDKLLQLFANLDSVAQKKVFENGIVIALHKIKLDISFSKYGFSPDALSSMIAVIGRIKSITALESARDLAIHDKREKRHRDLVYDILTALWEFDGIVDKVKLYALFDTLTEVIIDLEDKFILFDVFTMAAELFPDNFDDIFFRFVNMFQDLESELLNDDHASISQGFCELFKLLYEINLINKVSYNKLINEAKPVRYFIIIIGLNVLLNKNLYADDLEYIDDAFRKYKENDKLIVFDLFTLVIDRFTLEFVDDSFQRFGWILESMKNEDSYRYRFLHMYRLLRAKHGIDGDIESNNYLNSIKRSIRKKIIETNQLLSCKEQNDINTFLLERVAWA